MAAATIRIFLVHGDPKRLRTAELSNWTGKAVAGPRSERREVLDRPESDRSGVYFLTGANPKTGQPEIYIGEAESIKDRFRTHSVAKKEFWNQIVYFVSKDENLTKSHIRYLEGRLLEQARLAKRAVVANSQSSGARLPESDREEMEVFLEKINQLLPVLGVEFLVPVSAAVAHKAKKDILYCEIKGLKATGYPVPNGFLVLKGSEAVLTERPSVEKWPWPRNARQKLLDEGVLLRKRDRLIFSADMEFSSPSAAAVVIHGGHANGLIAWKTSDGKTLKDTESA